MSKNRLLIGDLGTIASYFPNTGDGVFETNTQWETMHTSLKSSSEMHTRSYYWSLLLTFYLVKVYVVDFLLSATNGFAASRRGSLHRVLALLGLLTKHARVDVG